MMETHISQIDDLGDQELSMLIKRIFKRLPNDGYSYRCIAPRDGKWAVISNAEGMWVPHITVRHDGSVSIF